MSTSVRPAAALALTFAAPPDPGVRESQDGKPGLSVEVLDGVQGDALAAAAARCDLLVIRSWQRAAAPVFTAGAGRLRAIVQASAGLDNIDAEAAARAGVRVVGVDPGNATAVTELTLMSLIALLRDVRAHWARTEQGVWPDREVLVDRELRGRTLGLVGIGNIGTRVARRARAFETHVLAYDPYVDADEVARRGAEKVESLDALLARSDALSLHCPLTPETRGMIGARELALLPRGAVLVNTARGPVMDEGAVRAALDAGHLAGAAVDVWPVEPPAPGGLLGHPRVLPTPHLGGHTAESHLARATNMIAALDRLVEEFR